MTPKGRKSIDWQDMQNRIIGLGEGSLHKSHYPELQARLRELERFRSLLDLSSDMIFTIDIDGGRIVDWNLAARCALGYDAPPSLADIDAAAAVAFLDRAKRADAAAEGETGLRRTLICDFRRADGSRFPVELAINLETASSDRYAIAVGRDITERIAAERQLRLAASVFDNSIEAVMVLFPDGAISAVNPAFAQITGHTAAEVIGKPVDLLRSPRHGAEFYRTLWAAVLDTGLWQGEIWSQRKNGETFPMWMAISAVRDDDGHPVQYICVFSDISRIKESERRLEHLTHHDPLTELPNRLFLGSAVEHALTRSKRDGQSFALLFIDIDRFKTINDTLGHETGDRLLRAAADRIVAAVRAVDLVAHLSGDEFVVMVEDIAAPEDAARVARKILRAFATPFDLDGFEAFISLSIGISLYPNHGTNSSALFRNGDSAMYGAKAEGGNRFQIYTQELTRIAFQNLEIETSLRRAIDGGELELYYQPQYRLADDSLYGVEALVRWQHPKRGTIPPDAFIPRAEETGLIVPMGARLLLDACRRARSWMDRGLSAVPVAVNISGVQISDSPIVDTVAEALATSGLPPGLLKLEITESFAMRGTSGSIDCLHALRGLGVELAIDDFGTGYASLSYLRELPINVIKIDREFVRNLPDHRGDCAIVEAIVAMAHGLGLLVVAEGVETEEQKAFLKAAGCDVSQGYLGGRPMPAADFETRLRPAPPRR